MNIVDKAIHSFGCQKSDLRGNSDFQTSQKLDLLQIPAKKLRLKTN